MLTVAHCVTRSPQLYPPSGQVFSNSIYVWLGAHNRSEEHSANTKARYKATKTSAGQVGAFLLSARKTSSRYKDAHKTKTKARRGGAKDHKSRRTKTTRSPSLLLFKRSKIHAIRLGLRKDLFED